MKKILAVLLMLSLVAPAAAEATTVLKGSFGTMGKAKLVDNRKRDKLSVHLRKLTPKTEYTFALYSVAKGMPRCGAGTQETAFAPKAKRTNRHGNLNARQRSKTFTADPVKSYFVLVSAGAAPVACAELGRKGHDKPAKGEGKGPKH